MGGSVCMATTLLLLLLLGLELGLGRCVHHLSECVENCVFVCLLWNWWVIIVMHESFCL